MIKKELNLLVNRYKEAKAHGQLVCHQVENVGQNCVDDWKCLTSKILRDSSRQY